MAILLRLVKLSVLPYGLLFRDRRPGAIILIYHRIGGGTSSESDLSRRVFARQMAYLRAHYQLGSMGDIARGQVAEGNRDMVVVTFDDGAQDIYEHAFPILRQYEIPATVYVTTRYVEEQRPFDFGGYARVSHKTMPLTWGQIGEMVASGLVTIGGHTHTHPDLTRLPAPEILAELSRSRELIADRLGKEPQHFAYPWARWTAHVREVVGQYFDTAAAAGGGKNLPGTYDPLALQRRPIQQSDGFWLFKLKLASFLDGEEYVRRIADGWRRTQFEGVDGKRWPLRRLSR